MPRKFRSSGWDSSFTVKATGRQPRKWPTGRTDRQTDGCVQPAAGQQAAGGYPQDPRSAAQLFGTLLPTALLGLDAFPTRSRSWPGSLRWGRFWVNSPPAGVCRLTTLFFLRTQKHILFTASYKLFTSRAEVIPLKPHGLLIPNSYLGTTFFFLPS